jgi:nucleotide-binding universal stress UspA family protein
MHLIVIATHGSGGFRRHLLGGVPQEVLRRATCPVLTVKPNDPRADEPGGFRSILVPVDFSWCSRLALSYARELAAVHGAALQLLHVVSDVTCPDVYLHGSQVTHQGRLHLECRAKRRLKDLADDMGQQDRRQVFVRFGRPASEIVRFARGAGCDLILMAGHGLGGLMKVMLGSVTSHVAHAAPCSVLVTNWDRQMVPGARVVSSHYRVLATAQEPAGTAGGRSGTQTAM